MVLVIYLSRQHVAFDDTLELVIVTGKKAMRKFCLLLGIILSCLSSLVFVVSAQDDNASLYTLVASLGRGELNDVVFNPERDVMFVATSISLTRYTLTPEGYNDETVLFEGNIEHALWSVATSSVIVHVESGAENTLYRLNPTNGEIIWQFLDNITYPNISPDGRTIAYKNNTRDLILLDIETLSTVTITAPPAAAYPYVYWSPQSDRFVTDDRYTFTLWDRRTGEDIYTTDVPRDIRIRDLRWDANGQILYTQTDEWSQFTSWDAESGELIETFRVADEGVRNPVWSPDGRYLVAISDNDQGLLSLWDFERREPILEFESVPPMVNRGLGWGDETTIIVQADDSVSYIWSVLNVDAPAQVDVILRGNLSTPDLHLPGAVSVLDGTSIIGYATNAELGLTLYDAQSWQTIDSISRFSSLNRFAFWLDNTTLQTYGALFASCGFRTWDVTTGTVIGVEMDCIDSPGLGVSSTNGNLQASIGSLVFDSDNNQEDLTRYTNGVVVYTLDEPYQELLLEGHTADVLSVRWIESDHLLSTSQDGTVRMWSVTMEDGILVGENLFSLEHEYPVWVAIASPDSTQIISGDEGGVLMIWDYETGTQLGSIQAHNGIIYDIAWSPDGSTMATVGTDGIIRLWQPN